jgi:hypothetical protein
MSLVFTFYEPFYDKELKSDCLETIYAASIYFPNSHNEGFRGKNFVIRYARVQSAVPFYPLSVRDPFRYAVETDIL